MSSALQKLLTKEDLSRAEARAAMLEIMENKCSPAQIAALLVALRMKGETVEEITGFAEAMREKMTTVSPQARPLVDTCGTGGDGARTFNISTAAAFVAAGAGVSIAKHGNRAVSSPCGSADVLEALGVNISLSPRQIADCIDAVGIGFMFAPGLHPAMKYAAPVRKELGIRTVFNLLGPLANPASAQAQLLGVYASTFTEVHAGVLKNLGSRRALVVHGLDGLDEITTTGPTQISELLDGKVITYHFSPEDYGLARAEPKDLGCGANPQDNARILLEVLEGKPGPKRDIVLLNAAAALIAADIAKDFKQGLARAAAAIDSGQGRAKLQALQTYTRELSAKTE
jgi:anthranilate phosphoribosyltransferase